MSKKDALFNPYREGDEDHLYFSDHRLIDLSMIFLSFLQIYFRYSVIGLRNIPKQGGALLVMNHGFVPIDMVFFASKVLKILKRRCRVLAHRRSWKVPVFREVALNLGIVNASPENAVRLLRRGELVCVFPGGEQEGLRPSSQSYELQWEGRTGFVETALEAKVPIVPCMGVGIDEIYHVFPKPRVQPIPFFMGLGAFPFPVKLTHHVGMPIILKKGRSDIKSVHAQVWQESQALLERGLKARRFLGLF